MQSQTSATRISAINASALHSAYSAPSSLHFAPRAPSPSPPIGRSTGPNRHGSRFDFSRLRYDSAMVVFVDVDDTLVLTAGTKRIPMPRSLERIKSLHAEGNILYLWSSGGADYARDSARELGILELFQGFLPKPNLILDDQPLNEWRGLVHEYPAKS
ncbi:MAG: DUF705 domain-containing protein [Chlorobia bacterium]|nr:DUF705 domain-containing protein [Fimbriimonadaceae bacterium]